MKLKNLPWICIAFFATSVGLYPLIYSFVDMRTFGLLQSKPKALIASDFYMDIFYTHITFGGIALLIGWTQFSNSWRSRFPKMHRSLGKVYITSVFLSSLAGLVIAFFASGGIVSSTGFCALAILWLVSIIKAYTSILNGDIEQHRIWMVRNYALTFAAVTLRVYVPVTQLMHIDFLNAYRAIAWLCWIPNLIVAEQIIRRPAKSAIRLVAR